MVLSKPSLDHTGFDNLNRVFPLQNTETYVPQTTCISKTLVAGVERAERLPRRSASSNFTT